MPCWYCSLLFCSHLWHDVSATSHVQIGDGDCGSTLAQGAAAIHQQLAALPWDDPALAVLALAGTLGRSMGVTSGAVVSCALPGA